MEIIVRSVAKEEQRYPTAGDWQWQDDKLVVTVTKQEDWRYEALLAVHEIVEALLCRYKSVSEQDVDAFDLAHIKITDAEGKFSADDLLTVREHGILQEYREGKAFGKSHEEMLDPGSFKTAPYRQQHRQALRIEEELAEHLEVDFEKYAQAVL